MNKELRHVRAALNWAHRRGYIPSVPHFTTAFIKVDVKRPRTFPEEVFVAMVKALNIPELKLKIRSKDWWKCFLYLAYYLGLRRGELLGLPWDCVDFQEKQLIVSATSSKSRRDRVIPLHAEIAKLLNDWKEKQPAGDGEGVVLPWPHDSYRPLYTDWHAIQDAAGFTRANHYVPRNCRSSCATELGRAGVDAAVAQKILGHAHITTTTKHYFDAEQLVRAAVEKRPVKEIPER